jgi:hypothetical protein
MEGVPSFKERLLTWSIVVLTAGVAGRTALVWFKAWWAAVNKP